MSSIQEVLPERASGILRRTLGLTVLGGGTLPDCHQVSLRWGEKGGVGPRSIWVVTCACPQSFTEITRLNAVDCQIRNS